VIGIKYLNKITFIDIKNDHWSAYNSLTCIGHGVGHQWSPGFGYDMDTHCCWPGRTEVSL